MARSSHAEYVAVPVSQLIPEAAGAELGGGRLALRRRRHRLRRRPCDRRPARATPLPSRRRRAASARSLSSCSGSRAHRARDRLGGNHAWLAAHGVTPVAYGDGLADRLKAAAPNGIDAFIDLFGPEYVQLAVDLGIAPDRIETIISPRRRKRSGRSRGEQ